jgi:hypothetical protein
MYNYNHYLLRNFPEFEAKFRKNGEINFFEHRNHNNYTSIQLTLL